MSTGFVYVLLNPAFPKQLKIGMTGRDPYIRAKELSRQTSVPNDFIVLYDRLVSDAAKVEEILHDRFDGSRVERNKEFFVVPPRDAIEALIEVAAKYPVSPSEPRLTVDLFPFFKNRFSAYVNPLVVGLRFVQLPGTYFLEIDSRTSKNSDHIEMIIADVYLSGLEAPDEPTIAVLGANEERLRACDEYDWIQLLDIFTPKAAEQIAYEWEAPGGRLEKLREEQACAFRAS